MKCILKKRIVPLLCVGLLLCTPHTIAYATAGGIETTMTQTKEPELPPTPETPPAVETSPPPVETSPPVETTPPPVEIPPTVETPPPPAVETTPPPVATTPPPTETTPPPAVETPPPAVEPPPAVPPEIPPTVENTEPSYSVEVSWESLVFDCAPIWNPDEHCYDEWESTENPITVTNTTINAAPIRVTLTFIPTNGMAATAAFAPCEDDPNPDEFTISNGQVSFLLPRDADKEAKATVNLFLTGDPMGLETQQYNQVGSIKTEITPLFEETLLPPGGSEIQPPPVSDLPDPPVVAEPAPPAPSEPEQPNRPEPPAQPSEPEPPAQPEQPPPPTAEGKPPEPVKPEQPPPVLPPPEQKDETQTAPQTESAAQEEPK